MPHASGSSLWCYCEGETDGDAGLADASSGVGAALEDSSGVAVAEGDGRGGSVERPFGNGRGVVGAGVNNGAGVRSACGVS